MENWATNQINRYSGTKNYEQKAQQVQDQADTLTAIAEGADSVRQIKERLTSLFQDTDRTSKPAVIFSTVHKAKGLEWTRVFILTETFNRKRPPGAPPVSPEAEAAQAREEANIYYVAVTRAKQTLVMANGKVK